MRTQGIPSTFKRLPKPWAAALHLATLCGSVMLLLGLKPGLFRSEAIMAYVPDFYLHVSNASISLLLYAGVGYLWLMLGVSMRRLALAGLVVIASNVVYELFLLVLNTRDVVDAWYGVAGVACGWVVLWIIDWRGMVPSPFASPTTP